MPKYIDADEFVRLKREWYCEQCQKRKGMKRGKLQFVYEIGGAPCRACDVDDVISDIEDFPAADVEPKQRWIPTTEDVPHIKEGCAGAVVVNAVYWAIGKYISMPLRYVRKKIRNKLVERWEYMDGSIVHKSVLYWMPLPEPPKENPNDK